MTQINNNQTSKARKGSSGATFLEIVFLILCACLAAGSLLLIAMKNNENVCNFTMAIASPGLYEERKVGWLFDDEANEWKCRYTPKPPGNGAH